MEDIIAVEVVTDQQERAPRCSVWESPLVGYIVFNDFGNDMNFIKTIDGGLNWINQTEFFTGTCRAHDIWRERWTPGDSGNLIHTWWIEEVTDNFKYRTISVLDDSLGTVRDIFDGATVLNTQCTCSGTKARGGNLYAVFNLDDSTESGFYRSTNGGVTWEARESPWEDEADFIHLFPGNESDPNDIWAVFWDLSANEVSLKVYDNSEDNWSEASIVSAADTAINNGGVNQMAGAIRHSDGHLILVLWNNIANPSASLLVFDINGAVSIVSKTNVVTNNANGAYCSVFIDPNTDDIYVAYNGTEDGSESLGIDSLIYYKKSTDGAVTWGSETPMSTDNTQPLQNVWSDLGGPESKFQPIWYEDSNQSLQTNVDNSVEVGNEELVTSIANKTSISSDVVLNRIVQNLSGQSAINIPLSKFHLYSRLETLLGGVYTRGDKSEEIIAMEIYEAITESPWNRGIMDSSIILQDALSFLESS